MSDEDLKRVAQRWFNAINSGDVQTLDQIVAYDVVDHSGLSDTHGFGREGHKKLSQQLLNTFSGWQSRIDNMSVDGDLVIIDHSGRASFPASLGPLMGPGSAGSPELGKVDFRVRSCVRIKNGQIVEHWALDGPFGQKSGPGAPGVPSAGASWSSSPPAPGPGTGAAGPVQPSGPTTPGVPSAGTSVSNIPSPPGPGTGTAAPVQPGGAAPGWSPPVSSTSATGSVATTDENKLLLQRYVKNVIDGQNPALADYYFVSNFFNHDRAPGEQPGLDGVKQFIGSIFAAFTGFQTTIEEQIAEDDLVVGRWSQSFTNTGPYLSFPASGKQIHIAGITITRVRDGKIVEEWEARDAVGLLVQMGVIPPLGPLEGNVANDQQRAANEAAVSRFVYEAWNAGDASVIDQIVSPSFVNHNLMANQSDGPAGLKQWINAWHSAFPDLNVAIDLLVSEGSKVAARWTLNGTHRATFLGIPATGKYVTIPGISIFRIENNTVSEGWGFWEQAGMLAQLGVVQYPQAPAAGPAAPPAASGGSVQPTAPSWGAST